MVYSSFDHGINLFYSKIDLAGSLLSWERKVTLNPVKYHYTENIICTDHLLKKRANQ